MRRADRLFQIIQVLRRTRKPLTADAIAAELETSKRTIYRDIATLIGQRRPSRPGMVSVRFNERIASNSCRPRVRSSRRAFWRSVCAKPDTVARGVLKS